MDTKIKKVMLVDSSDISINRLKRLLSEIKNIQFVGVAENSTEAIAIFNLMNPEVVILDIQLPGNNGMQVLRDIKSRFSSVQVIVLTNNADSKYRSLCMDFGADYFFDKSTEFEKIPDILITGS